MKNCFDTLYDFVIDLVFPARCPACHEVVGWNRYFCPECEKKLEYLEEAPWQALFPAKIGEEEPAFDRAEALFSYEGTAREAVLSFKYRRSRKLAAYAAERLSEKLAENETDRISLVTSVPMHYRKRLDRGYDQAEVLARALSKELGVRCETKLLGHRRRKRSQHELAGKDRFSAAESTYFIRKSCEGKKDLLSGECVLLCDDIFTTGSTANKCAKLLKELGAEKVYVAVICLRVPDTKKKSDAE